ncbi:MAG: zeta toxin family protein [Nocardioidaceae bacterium]|nr:zeta toxin family protein [Nocardioidaceae bacterium]MCL2611741.1 zeta toxin family protein [Nocardioidaceae bacterium]
MSTPVLHLLAGPNGAGKSTLATRVLVPRTHLPFVNADVIAAERWPEAQLEHAYEASQVAAQQREWLLASRRSFVTETVFSHQSKIDLVGRAAGAGYLVQLHVVMVSVEVSVGRVAHRVGRGGHDVPEQKVRDRYDRLWTLVAAACDLADRTTFYDNSSARSPYRVVATFDRGRVVGSPCWPAWAPVALTGSAWIRPSLA